jgi:hypothetical protein
VLFDLSPHDLHLHESFLQILEPLTKLQVDQL